MFQMEDALYISAVMNIVVITCVGISLVCFLVALDIGDEFIEGILFIVVIVLGYNGRYCLFRVLVFLKATSLSWQVLFRKIHH